MEVPEEGEEGRLLSLEARCSLLQAAEAVVDQTKSDKTDKRQHPVGLGVLQAFQARVGRVVFAASDAKRGALGGCLNLAADPSAHHHMTIVAGVRGQAAQQQLSDWFRRRRAQR